MGDNQPRQPSVVRPCSTYKVLPYVVLRHLFARRSDCRSVGMCIRTVLRELPPNGTKEHVSTSPPPPPPPPPPGDREEGKWDLGMEARGAETEGRGGSSFHEHCPMNISKTFLAPRRLSLPSFRHSMYSITAMYVVQLSPSQKMRRGNETFSEPYSRPRETKLR